MAGVLLLSIVLTVTATRSAAVPHARFFGYPFLNIFHSNLSTVMIRRPPTLIRMTDLDVQDVRDMVAQQKQDIEVQKTLMNKIKRVVEDPNMSPADLDLLEKYKVYQSKNGMTSGYMSTSSLTFSRVDV